jgi:hypothetical protein
VAGELQPQTDIHKAVSRLFFVCFVFVFVFVLFFSFFDEMTELGLDAEGLTETVLHLNLEYFLFCFVSA